MIERIAFRMKRHIGKIEKLEQEIKKLRHSRGAEEKKKWRRCAEKWSGRSARPECRLTS